VAELQRLLEVLREETAASAARTPQPGLAQLDELVAQFRTAGLDVTLTTDGPLALPPGLDLVTFRIVQESLTNALKHAGAPTRVLIARHHSSLTIEVINDGPAHARDETGATTGCGHGLIGMRERVQLYDGTLHAAPTSGGGFAVRAVLPVTSDIMMEEVQ
jgi:signal transduction histidine kinase